MNLTFSCGAMQPLYSPDFAINKLATPHANLSLACRILGK